MNAKHSFLEKDILLRKALGQLGAKGIGASWRGSVQPFTQLHGDCSRLAGDDWFHKSLVAYLRTHTTLPRAVQMLFTSMAMAASAKWQEVPEPGRGVAARGWFLGRWISTFPIIDGPIGR
jgi:hypothetical protein